MEAHKPLKNSQYFNQYRSDPFLCLIECKALKRNTDGLGIVHFCLCLQAQVVVANFPLVNLINHAAARTLLKMYGISILRQLQLLHW